MKNKIITVIFVILVLCVFISADAIGARFDTDGIYVSYGNGLDTIEAHYTGSVDGRSAVHGYADNTSDVTTYGVFGQSAATSGMGVLGKTTHPEGGVGVCGESFYVGVWGEDINSTRRNISTYGVFGRSNNVGVCGVANAQYNRYAIGVYGLTDNSRYPDSFGVVSEGHAKVIGNLTVTGDIIEKQNVARISGVVVEIVKWDGENEIPAGDVAVFGPAYSAENLIDDQMFLWDVGEWASGGVRPRWNDPRSWIGAKLIFPESQIVKIDKVITYFRPNPVDHILDYWLYVNYRDGTQFYGHCGEGTFSGLGKETRIPAEYSGREVRSVLLKITDSVPGILNVGLAEIECLGSSSSRPL